MSLLMEALRKAEQAKRRMQQDEQSAREEAAPAPPAFTLEEREPDVTPEYIRDNFTTPGPGTQDDAHAASTPAQDAGTLADEAGVPSRHADQRRQRAAAASVFAAKRRPARSRRTLAVLVTILVLMLPVGGGILWYLQGNATSSIGLNPALVNYDLSARRFDDVAAAPASPDTVATATEDELDANLAETGNTLDDDASATAALADTGAARDRDDARFVDTQRAAAPVPPNVLAQPAAPQSAAAETPAPAAVPPTTSTPSLPPTASTPVLEISRSRGAPQVNPDLVTAYARLQEGDLAGAGALYRQVLAALPNNRDALLGLASVHMREERPANARELYARLLQLNPRDPLAHTGLLQTMQAGSPAEHENTLKQLQAQYPNVAQLTLALGNHYAAQGRWSEAQAAYYNALLTARRNSNGPVHPDYAFNLAVSLEQLNQPKAALDYYRQAQALAADVTPGFDLQLLNSRLEYLLEQAPR